MELSEGTTYLIESREDKGALLALHAKIQHERLEWFDTVRDRVAKVEDARRDGDAVVVKTPRARYRLRPLTLELYLAKVQDKVDGRPDLSSDAEVQELYANFPS